MWTQTTVNISSLRDEVRDAAISHEYRVARIKTKEVSGKIRMRETDHGGDSVIASDVGAKQSVCLTDYASVFVFKD